MRLHLALAVLFSLISVQLLAQDSLTVIPGPEYEAGWLHRMLFGSGWRDLWTTPIKVEYVDPSAFGGVQTGLDTQAVMFRTTNGKAFTLRLLNKNPQQALDPIILQCFTEDVAHDLISTMHPVSALVSSSILDGGVDHFYYVLRGVVGVKEQSEEAGSPREADQFASTYELFQRLDKDNDEFVDASVYLKSRLMDVFLGDWDLRANQLQWGGYQNHGRWVWTVFARDHDQAFSRYTGIVGWILTQQVPQIESFSDSYPWISDLTWSGRHIDRRLLSGIDRHSWDSIATNVSRWLSDEVIDGAVRKMPQEMYEKEGETFARTLKSRRDKFKEASDEYYANLARFVDIHASDQNEYADVERVGNDTVIVSLYKRDKTTGGTNGNPFYRRTFDRNETKEIRIYLQGGEDFIVVRGNASESIPVRIVGGDGEDELADSLRVSGFVGSRTTTYFYESDSKAEFIYGPSTQVEPDDLIRPAEDSLRYEPLYRDWGHEWKGFPELRANSDEGVYVGGIAQLENYGFRSIPYHDKATFKAGYAFGANKFRAVYEHTFPDVFAGTLDLFARASNLEVLNFFGLGNNTSYDKTLAGRDLYKIDHLELAFLPGYSISALKHITIGGFAGVRILRTDLDGLPDSAVLRLTKPYGVQDALYSSIGVSGTYDSRDNSRAPQEGVYFTIGNSWNPEIFDNAYAYTKAHAEFRGYYTAPALNGITLAVRARGEKIFGNRFPFYDAVFLGGTNDLRGYASQRFAGDASVLATAELRLNIAKFAIVVPGTFGIHAFAEEGRVFYEGETSEARHSSFGGGIWIAPLDPENTVALTFARSSEQLTIALTGGFAF